MSESFNTPKEMDAERRLALKVTGAAGAVVGAGVAIPLLSSFAPSEKAKAAGAPVEFDTANLKPGEMATVEWRGKPVWILKRSPEMVEGLKKVEGELADPKSLRNPKELTPKYAQNQHRSIKPDVLVAVGICSHLGCSPSSVPDAATGMSGFICPCHGSTFDLAGRVYKNKPAPDNLEVPPHMYLSDTRIIIGEDKA